jgi:hypothetical protein
MHLVSVVTLVGHPAEIVMDMCSGMRAVVLGEVSEIGLMKMAQQVEGLCGG